MSAGELAAVLTAATALFTSLAGAVANLMILVSVFRTTRTTHAIVNRQGEDAAAYRAVTTDALREAGIGVPSDPSPGAPDARPSCGG
jgi:hypothetical protein